MHCHKKVRFFVKGKYSEKINYNIWIHEQEFPKTNPDVDQSQFFHATFSKQKCPEDRYKKEHQSVSQAELSKALQSCKNSARQAYNINLKYAKQIERLLQRLYENIQRNNLFNSKNNLFYSKKSKYLEDGQLLNNIILKIEQLLNKNIEALRLSLDSKKTHLEDYSIALFGRTKAGKSTIREALTRGDGSTIGKGAQRTTREVYEYQWQGLRLIDTPGIEAYQGEEDTAKANQIIDQADMVIFLTSDESVQPGEFESIAKLKKLHKHFVILLNVKENLDNPKRLQRFLQNSEKIFDEQRLSEHHDHIISQISQNLEIEKIEIINIQAMAAFLSTQPEHKDISTQLWKLSRIEEIYVLISEDIYNYGNKRRISTFFDSTSLFLAQIEDDLLKCEFSLKEQIYFLETKQKDIDKLFDNFIEDSQRKVDDEIKNIFSKLTQEILYFVDDILEMEAEQEWKKLIEKYSDLLQNFIKRIFQEIQAELKEKLEEFENEYNYDAVNINFDLNINDVNLNINNINQGQTGDFLKTIGLVCSGIAAVAFIAANWWNPAGWMEAAALVPTGLSIIAHFSSGFVKDNEKKEFNQKLEDLKSELNDKQSAAICECNQQVKTQLEKIKQDILKSISLFHDGLYSILEEIEDTINILKDLHNSLNCDRDQKF